MLRNSMKNSLRKIRGRMYKSTKETTYLKILYLIYQRGILHLNNPKRFSEKLFYLKLYYRTQKDFIQEIYDKYTARAYAEKKIGEQYLSKLYGVYDSADEIDFERLPDKFAIKVTQSSGCNLFCNGKDKFQVEEARKQMNIWQQAMDSKEYLESSEEGYFHTGKSKIICEEFLEDSEGNIPLDIRLWCFNGKVKFYCMDFDTVDEEGNKKKFYYRNTYMVKGDLVPVNLGRPYNTAFKRMDLPHFREMVQVAEKLAEEFVFVRVDLYNIDGRIIFGELTPLPQSGSGRITPRKYDYKFGKMLKLPDVSLKDLVRDKR